MRFIQRHTACIDLRASIRRIRDPLITMHKAALLLPITAMGFYMNITMVSAEEASSNALTLTEISANYDADKRACQPLLDDARDQCQIEARNKREAARMERERVQPTRLTPVEAATATTMLPAR